MGVESGVEMSCWIEEHFYVCIVQYEVKRQRGELKKGYREKFRRLRDCLNIFLIFI